MLNDTRYFAVFTGNAAIAGRIVKFDRQQANAALWFGIAQPRQGFSGDQRHIAIQHQNVFIIRKKRRCLLHRVTGAQLFGL